MEPTNIKNEIAKLKSLIVIEKQNMNIAMIERNFSAYGNHNAKWVDYNFKLKQLKAQKYDRRNKATIT